MLSRNKCVIKIDISLFLAVQTLSGSVNSIVCDRNEFNTKKTTLQGLWFHVPSLNRTNGISIYLINKVAPKQKYQRRKRNKSESKTFMFHGEKTARTRTQSWSCVHCRCAAQKKGKTKRSGNLSAHGSHPMVPAAPASRLEDHAGPGSSWAAPSPGRPFFYFYILYFRFLQKYIFDFEICRNIPRPPVCRAAGTWPPGSGAAGAFVKKISRRKLHAGPWGPVARHRGGRPLWPPGCGAAGPGRPAAGRPAVIFVIYPFSRNNFTYVPFCNFLQK